MQSMPNLAGLFASLFYTFAREYVRHIVASMFCYCVQNRVWVMVKVGLEGKTVTRPSASTIEAYRESIRPRFGNCRMHDHYS